MHAFRTVYANEANRFFYTVVIDLKGIAIGDGQDLLGRFFFRIPLHIFFPLHL